MKTKQLLSFTVAAVALLYASSGFAADKFKANNTVNANVVGSWSATSGGATNGVAVPGSGDRAVWDSTDTSTATPLALGASLTWQGIQVLAPTTPQTISSGTFTLSLNGASQTANIDMSSAGTSTADFTNNAILSITGLGSGSVFNVASGRTLTLGGTTTISAGGSTLIAKIGAGNLILTGTNTFNSNSGTDQRYDAGGTTVTYPGTLTAAANPSFKIGTISATSATFTNNGGTVSYTPASGGSFEIGQNGGTGTLVNNAGGTMVVAVNNTHMNLGDGTSSTGTFIQNGGLVLPSGNNQTIQIGAASGGTGTLRLNGGMLICQGLTTSAGTGTAFFNGGTLRPIAALTTFVSSVGNAYISAGGLNVDDNGLAISIPQILLTDSVTPSSGGGLTKLGSVTLTLNPTSPETYTGATVVNGGTLFLDSSTQTTPTTGVINSSSTLKFGNNYSGGGALVLNGKSGATITQTFNGVTASFGGNTISNNVNSSTAVTIALGSITRPTQGGTVDFGDSAAAGHVTTTTSTNGAGILGGWATYKQVDWATTNASGQITSFPSGSYVAMVTTGGAQTNYTSAGTTLTGATTINSLKLTGGTLALGNFNLTLSDASKGGLLVAAASTITEGSGVLSAGAGNELIMDVANGVTMQGVGLTFGSTVTKTGPGTWNIDHSGGSGPSITGNLNILQGVVSGNINSLAATSIMIANGASLRFSSTGPTIGGSVTATLGGNGAICGNSGGGNPTLGSHCIVYPGGTNSPGIFYLGATPNNTVGSGVTITSGCTFVFDLSNDPANTNANDKIVAAYNQGSSFTISSINVTINMLNGILGAGVYTLIDASTGGFSGTPSVTPTWTGGSAPSGFAFTTSGNKLLLTITNPNPACLASTPTTPTASPSATVCSGNQFILTETASGGLAPYTYQWTHAGTNLPGATASTYTNSTPATTDSGSYTCTVTTSCGTATASSGLTVTVNQTPTVTLGTSPSVCQTVTSASLPYTATTGSPTVTFIAYDITAQGQGFTAANGGSISGTSGNLSLTVPSGAAAGTYNGTLIVSNATCASSSVAFTVTVNTTPTITSVTSPTVCQGTTSASLPYTATGSPDKYSITYDATAHGQSFTDVGNTTLPGGSITLAVPAGATPGTYNGTLFTKINSSGCTSSGQAFTVTVSQPGTVSAGPSQQVCQNVASVQLAGSKGGSTATVTWSGGAGSFDNANLLNAVYTPVAGDITAGTITLTLTGSGQASPCSAPVSTMTITFNPAPTVTASPTNLTVCSGFPAVFGVTAAGGHLTYQWLQSQNGGSFTNAPGISTNILYTNLTAQVTDNGTLYEVTVSGDCGSPTTSSTATLTVNTTPTVLTQTGSQTACTNSSTSFSVTTTAGTPTYQWYKGASPLSDGSEISGSSSAMLTINPVGASDAGTYVCVTTDTAAGNCTVATTNAVLTVDQGPAIASASGNQTICQGSTATFTVSATGGDLTYQWQLNSGGGFGNISGATASSYTTPATAPTDNGNQYQAVVSSAFSCGAPVTSTPATLTVNPTSVGGTASAVAGELCTGNSTTINLSGNVGNVQWQQSANGSTGWATVTGGSGSTTTSYTTPNLTVTTFYRALVTSGVCSSATSSTAQVTVDPASVGGTATATATAVFTGGSTTINLTGNTGNIQWQSSTTSSSTGFSNIGGANSSSLSTGTLTQNTWFRAISTSGVCSSSTSTVAAVSVGSAYKITPATVAATAGVSTNLTITLVDATGTTVALGGGRTVTFAGLSASPAGTNATANAVAIGTSSTVTLSGSGTATIAVVPATSGSSTLTASDTGGVSTGNTGGAGALINVGAGSATQLRWTTQPSGAAYSTTFTTQPILVTADVFGNPTTVGLGATQNVTVSVSGGGTLSGTTSFNIGTNGLNGTNVFTDLKVNAAGAGKVLTATYSAPAAPALVSSTASIWLDANNLSTLTTNGSGVVSAWANQGTLGSSMVVPPGNSGAAGGSLNWVGPNFTANSLNGKPVLKFVSSCTGNLPTASQTGSVLSNRWANLDNTPDLQFFAVVRQPANPINNWGGWFAFSRSGTTSGKEDGTFGVDADNANTTGWRMFRNDSRTSPAFATGNNGDGNMTSQGSGGGGWYTTRPANNVAALNTFFYQGGSQSGAEYWLDQNGNTKTNFQNSSYNYGNFNVTEMALGAQLGLNGAPANDAVDWPISIDVAEVIVITNSMTAADRLTINQYLQGKWLNSGIAYSTSLGSAATASFTVAGAPLTVTANNDSKTYGQTKTYGAGSAAFSSVGLLNGETIGTVTITDTSSGGVNTAATGGYPLTPSAATGGTFSAANYSITYTAGTLTVNPLAVTLSGSKTYNGNTSVNAASLAVANAVNGDTVNVASGSGTLASKDVGSRAITSFGSLALGNNTAGNYTLSGASGSVTVTALAVNLTGSRPFDGTATADFSILTVANAAGGDTVNVASGSGTLAASTPGPEAITSFGTLALGNNSAGDYTLSGASGTVTITTYATTNTLVATPSSPSIPGVNVVFTNTVSVVAPGTGIPTGTVIIKTNGVAVAGPLAVDGSGVSYTDPQSLPYGSNYVTVEYSGDANYNPSTNTVAQIVDNVPVPGSSTLDLTVNTSASISTAKLLSKASDDDNDGLSIPSVTTTTAHGTASLSGGAITYTPTANYTGSDTITYALSDGLVNVSGTINVTVHASAQSQNILSAVPDGNNDIVLTFAGIPGSTYHVEVTYSLTAPVTWHQTVANSSTTAPSNGIWSFTDTDAHNHVQSYYRTVSP